ncbi:MAG: hypothetical protein FWG46_03280 [Treponema sp.]|nr:hypothetical protein [Treponema sp.]
MKVPEKYYDEVFDFRGQWDMPSRCGLKIIGREKTVVIVTELYQDNPGTSVTAAGRSLAEQICRDKNLRLENIAYLECNPDTDSKLSFYDEDFFEADFTGDRLAYRQLDAREIRELFPEGID